MKKKSKILITGIAGFAGSYLAGLLILKGYRVYGLLAPGEKTDKIKPIINDLKLERFDLVNKDKTARFLKKVKPDYIYHLAAFASVGQSFKNERLTYDINFTGSLNIFEPSVLPAVRPKKIMIVTSADIYGWFKPKNLTLTEEQQFNPVSPYGISKVATEYLALYYFRQYRLPILRARAFNHTAPGQAGNFVVPSFCRQIAAIEKGGKKPEMAVGNLTVRRDLSDVRDIVKGYYLMMAKGKPGEVYHLCSGKAVSIQTVLNKLLKMSREKIKVSIDKKLCRKADIPILRGDNCKAIKELGWQCRYKLDNTLKDTLNYWRDKIR